MRWFVPSWNGDFRLEGINDKESLLVVTKPTAREIELLNTFLADARKKKWLGAENQEDLTLITEAATIRLTVPVTKAGPVLVKATKPKDRTLTAVSFRDGRLEVAETGMLTTLADKAADEDAKAAVSVARPTPSCPGCVPGAIEPASEVLLSFLTSREHDDWAANRAIIVSGGSSGHRYLLAHRHSDTARRIGRICYDLDDSLVIHFHDWSVPPEEEVLAAKLILEHREPWLRNEATVLWQTSGGAWVDLGYMRYKNPFGDQRDGVMDAAMTKSIGLVAQALTLGSTPKKSEKAT